MGLSINVNGSWESATPFVNIDGAWQEVQNAYVNVNGTWTSVFQAYTPVSVTPANQTVGGACNNGRTDTTPCTATATATVAGHNGNGSYSYTWSQVSGPTTVIGHPAGASCTFTDTENANNQTETAVFQCVVSDGKTSATATVTVQLSFDNNA